jgi:hypothetical protein
MKKLISKPFYFILLFIWGSLFAQQVPDLGYKPPIENPAYAKGEGSRVGIDEAHTNFHTATGRYAPFANLVMRDGYRVARVKKAFSDAQLKNLNILVIANPIHRRNDRNWELPTPSAYTDDEIAAVYKWVKEGGSLFLILDHMPFPGGGGKLAEVFGFKFSNGFAYLGNSLGSEPDEYKPGSGLMDCVITQGRNEDGHVYGIRFSATQGSNKGSGFSKEVCIQRIRTSLEVCAWDERSGYFRLVSRRHPESWSRSYSRFW